MKKLLALSINLALTLRLNFEVKKYILLIFLLLTGICAQAQFRTAPAQAAKPLGKNWWYGLTGRDSLSVARVWSGSLFMPGYAQLYNHDYWKLPVLYGGIGGLIYGGYRNNMNYLDTGDDRYETNRNLCYIGAGVLYWAALLDGVASYKTPKRYVPSRATIYSVLLPGLGQFNNEHYWKIPIVYLGLAFGAYWIDYNNTQYQRFRNAYDDVTNGRPDEFNGRYTADNLKYYRDSYHTNRDYAYVYLGIFYVLNIIDANVFSHLKAFDVSNNLSLQMRPTIMYDDMLASRSLLPAFGVSLNMNIK